MSLVPCIRRCWLKWEPFMPKPVLCLDYDPKALLDFMPWNKR